MYRQMDGYPDGHGQELKEFLQGMVITNGICLGETRRTANGMGCLAAQVVAHFKKGVGGFYLHPARTRDVWEDYVYTISQEDGRVHLRISDRSDTIYDGLIDDLNVETLVNP